MATAGSGINMNYYCPDCKLSFGALPDEHGNILCPFCKKSIEVVPIDRITYQCCSCNLKFGVVHKEIKQIQCPVCLTVELTKGEA